MNFRASSPVKAKTLRQFPSLAIVLHPTCPDGGRKHVQVVGARFMYSESNNTDHAPKRLKTEDGTINVFISCFDEPDKLVEVPVSLLESMNCRLALLVRNTAPSVRRDGRRFFRAGPAMTRAMLITFVKSSATGELLPCKGVTVAEAIRVFEYECPNDGGTLPPSVSLPSTGLAFCKRGNGVMNGVATLCERIADAIVQWPRLESIMTCATPPEFVDEQPSSFCGDSQAMQYTATATRAWIRFADRPKVSAQTACGCDPVLALATENPRWLSDGLMALGVMHYRMSQTDPELKRLRDESSFKKLYAHVTADPLGSFFAVRTDALNLVSYPRCKRELTMGVRTIASNSAHIQFIHSSHFFVSCSDACVRFPQAGQVFEGNETCHSQRNARKPLIRTGGGDARQLHSTKVSRLLENLFRWLF